MCAEHERTHGGHAHHRHDEAPGSADQRAMVLEYLLNHNREHLDELRGLSLGKGEEAEACFNDAVVAYGQANALLQKYLESE